MRQGRVYARQDLNLRLLAPEASALSVLSYGRATVVTRLPAHQFLNRLAGKPEHHLVAEGVGFEPTARVLPQQRLSKPASSTSRASLLKAHCIAPLPALPLAPDLSNSPFPGGEGLGLPARAAGIIGFMTGFPLNHYRAFLVDIDGVVVRGGEVLPGATEAIHILRQHGQVLFLTNNSTQSRRGTAARLAGVGLPVGEEEVIPSSYVAAQYLRERFGRVRYWYIGEEGIAEEMELAGHVPSSPTEAEWIVVGVDRQLTYEKLRLALRGLLSGARLIATNRDPTFPTPEGLVPGAGAVVGALTGMGFPPEVVVGKPSPIAFQVALNVIGVAPQEALMIGDRVDTDVAGAKGAGLDAALVLSGVTESADVQKWSIQPDWIAKDISSLARGELFHPWEAGERKGGAEPLMS